MDMNKTYDYKKRLFIAVVALACFGFVAYQVAWGRTDDFDMVVDYAVYDLRNPVTKAIFIPITYLGNWFSNVGTILVFLMVPATRKKVGLPAAVTGAIGVGIYKALKSYFARPRPDVSLHLIDQGGWSFPSGHSMNGLICYGVLIFLIWRGWPGSKGARAAAIGFTCLILAIGFSRIFVGVHFVTDVLGGWSMGLAYLMAATVVLDRFVLSRADRREV